MKKETLEILESAVNKFRIKKVEVRDVTQEKKFIQSISRVYTLNNGEKICREEIVKGGADGSAVIVIPVVGDQILTVVEPRVFTKRTVGVGFPAGYINPNEPSAESAKRELREETGYVAGKLIELDSFYQDEGCSSALNRIYLALDCKKEFDQDLDQDEYIECIPFSYEELLELENQGYICGANSKIALLRMEKYFRKK